MIFSRREFLVASSSFLLLPRLLRQDRPALQLETIRKSGDPENRVNVVFVAEGYSERSQDKFNRTMETMMRDAWDEPVLKDYADYFNYFVVRTVAEKDWDGKPEGSVFGTSINREDKVLLVDWNKVGALLPAEVPKKNVIILLVNNSETVRAHGGGTPIQGHMAVGHELTAFRHELGHALGMLGDEYPDGGFRPDGLSINASAVENPVPWEPAIKAGAPGVGVFKVPGLKHTYYRGEEKCAMLCNVDFYGAICRWGVLMGILRHTRILDEYGTNRHVVPAAYVPDLQVKYLAPESAKTKIKWVMRKVEEKESYDLMATFKAADYTFDTLNEDKGWKQLDCVWEPNKRSTSLPLKNMEPGLTMVAVFAQDMNPWVYGDPWKLTVDARAWIVHR